MVDIDQYSPPERDSTEFFCWMVCEERNGTYTILRMKGDRKVLKPLEKIAEIPYRNQEAVIEFFKRELAF